MCVFLGSRISLHSLPSPTLSFHKPSDAELTYFLGAEIQKDERRFTSYFLPFFFFLAGILASRQPTPFSCLRHIHLFPHFYPSLSTAHSPPFVTSFLPSLFFSSHGYFYPAPGSFFLFSSSFHVSSFVDFFLSFCYLSGLLFILGKFFLWTF